MDKDESLHSESEQENSVPAMAKPKDNDSERNKSENKRAVNADLFLLDKIYPDAVSVFQPTEDLTPKSKNVAVALDTNALLLPYLLGKGDLSALATVYSQFVQDKKLFLPERVAREFIKNRDRKLAEMAQALDDRISKMAAWDAKVTSLLLDGFSEREALAASSESLDAATKNYLNLLRSLSSHVKSWRGNDPVTALYANLFTKERLIGPNETREKIINELEYGKKNFVPPGYKDNNKEDNGIGDVIIWMSLLNIGRITNKDLIFITGEQKADWFVRSGNRPVYPRPELVDAYRNASGGRSLRLSSLHDVLREMSAPDALVTDVKVAEATANNAINAISSASLINFPNVKSDSLPAYAGDYTGHDEMQVSGEEISLSLQLRSAESDLNLTVEAINKIYSEYQGNVTFLSSNENLQTLGGKASELRKKIQDLRFKISELHRLKRKGGY